MIIQKILEEIGITGKELSEKLGINYNWYRRATMPSKRVKPNWAKAFEIGFELGESFGRENFIVEKGVHVDFSGLSEWMLGMLDAEKKSDASRDGVVGSASDVGPRIDKCIMKDVDGHFLFIGFPEEELVLLKEKLI